MDEFSDGPLLDDKQEKYDSTGPAFVGFYPIIDLDWQAA